MPQIYYKISSMRSYNTMMFDTVDITLCELKTLIKEKLRATNSDLLITNGETKEEYTDDDCLIPDGSSLIIRRVPPPAGKSSSSAKRSRHSQSYNYNSGLFKPTLDGQKSAGVLAILSRMTNFATADVSEDDKIKTIMKQSCNDVSNYQKCAPQLPANYICYRCGTSGHHIQSCPMIMDKTAETPVRIKRSTGIPRSFMVKVDDQNLQGAMLTSTGEYAIPAIHAEAYAAAKKNISPQEQQTEETTNAPIPDELLCFICQDLLNDAVVIPCCGNGYCDDCIRSVLLDSEDFVCPSCRKSGVLPDTLAVNKFLRKAVNEFKKEQSSLQPQWTSLLFKSTPSASQSKGYTPRPRPAPTPPSQSQLDKPRETDTVISSESPHSSSWSSVKVVDEAPEKERDMKINCSTESSSLLVSDISVSDSVTQSTTLAATITKVVPDNSNSGFTAQCDRATHWERHYSPYSSHRGLSSHSRSSRLYNHRYKRPRSTYSGSHSPLRSRSPRHRHKSHHHHSSRSSSGKSSRRRKEREASERNYYDTYFHFHQMAPMPLMPPPQPHWPGQPQYYHHHRGHKTR